MTNGSDFGDCIKKSECPCVHNGEIYNPGAEIHSKCKQCTCEYGQWKCEESSCHSTCTIGDPFGLAQFDGKNVRFLQSGLFTMVKTELFELLVRMELCGNYQCVRSFELYFGPSMKFRGQVRVDNVYGMWSNFDHILP